MSETIEVNALSRYDMTYYTFRQLQRDYIRFEEKYTDRFGNNFICRILINYMCYAQEHFINQFEANVTERLKHANRDDYFKDDRISFTKLLTDKMLEFDFVSHKDFKKRTVITFILEQFTQLQLSEREKIYCYMQYQTTIELIAKNELFLVSLFSGNEYEVKPYSIEVDENTRSYYLIGFSRLKRSEDEFMCHSFKLSRIKDCKSRHKESILSSKDINTAKDIREKFGSAYMMRNLTKKDIEKTVVRLSEYGYENLFLKRISHQRPIPITEPKKIEENSKKFYDLTFDCSHQQIRNYFFSFGAEAEILFPLSVRERFIRDYQEAIKRYNSENN